MLDIEVKLTVYKERTLSTVNILCPQNLFLLRTITIVSWIWNVIMEDNANYMCSEKYLNLDYL